MFCLVLFWHPCISFTIPINQRESVGPLMEMASKWGGWDFILPPLSYPHSSSSLGEFSLEDRWAWCSAKAVFLALVCDPLPSRAVNAPVSVFVKRRNSSRDGKHKDAIELGSLAWGVFNSAWFVKDSSSFCIINCSSLQAIAFCVNSSMHFRSSKFSCWRVFTSLDSWCKRSLLRRRLRRAASRFLALLHWIAEYHQMGRMHQTMLLGAVVQNSYENSLWVRSGSWEVQNYSAPRLPHTLELFPFHDLTRSRYNPVRPPEVDLPW